MSDEDDDQDRETDQNGVEFSRNCLSPYTCRKQDLCYGLCRLF